MEIHRKDIFNYLKRIFVGVRSYERVTDSQRGFIMILLCVCAPPLLLFGMLQLVRGNILTGAVECFGVLLFAASIYCLKFEWCVQVIRFALLLFAMLLFSYLFIDGGMIATAQYWSLVFPFGVFALMGIRKGWVWILLFVMIQLLLATAAYYGLLTGHMSYEQALYYFAMLLFFTLVAAVFETHQELQQQELSKAQVALSLANSDLEYQVKQKTHALINSNEQLRKEIAEKHKADDALLESEKKFHQAQKMEAIGTLAGGIAHDFNNMLSGVMAHLFMLERNMPLDADASDRLGKISALLNHATGMIKQLMTFARKDVVAHKPVDFLPFLIDAYDLARVSIPEHIHVTCDFPEASATVHGDATQLQQVLMNLMNNARDALDEVERPEIHVAMWVVRHNGYHHHNNDHTKPLDVEMDQYVYLSVSDNGSGIAAAQLDKIFEPFFSTKAIGKGTGLGLAMVYGAIQSHYGFIHATSTPGMGTSFHIYLPIQEHAKQSDEVEDVVLIEGRGKTILLVDDDVNVLKSTQECLVTIGYRVLVAENGLEAVRVFESNVDAIDLIVSDVVMPEMSGPLALERMRAIRADTPAIFLTGYDKDDLLDNIKHLNGVCMLGKPVSAAQLSAEIARVLAEFP